MTDARRWMNRFWAKQAGSSNKARIHEWAYTKGSWIVLCCDLKRLDPYAQPQARPHRAKCKLRACNGPLTRQRKENPT